MEMFIVLKLQTFGMNLQITGLLLKNLNLISI